MFLVKHHFALFILILCHAFQSNADVFEVKGLLVYSIAQIEDDEEAPFEIRAVNKRHKCGGDSSNLFRVYSEYDLVGERRFNMAMTAMELGYTLSLSTKSCEGKALIVNKIKISR